MLGCEVKQYLLCGHLLKEEAQYVWKGNELQRNPCFVFMSTDKSMIPIFDFCHYNAMRESPNVVGKKNVP